MVIEIKLGEHTSQEDTTLYRRLGWRGVRREGIYNRGYKAALMGVDQVVGALLMTASAVIFTYYTIWTILLPFVDSKQAIHAYFPPRIYAIAIPTVLLILFIVVVTTFIGVTLAKTSANKKTEKKES